MLRGALGRECERPRPPPRLLVPRPIRTIRPARVLQDQVAGHPHTQMIAARRKFAWPEAAIGKLGIEDVVFGHRPLSLGDVDIMLKRRRSVGPAAGTEKPQRFAHPPNGSLFEHLHPPLKHLPLIPPDPSFAPCHT